MNKYQWHHGVPVINDFDPARVASILLPVGETPPAVLTPKVLYALEGYNILIGAYPDQPTRYRLLPEGIDMCYICEGAGCDACDQCGYTEAVYDAR